MNNKKPKGATPASIIEIALHQAKRRGFLGVVGQVIR